MSIRSFSSELLKISLAWMKLTIMYKKCLFFSYFFVKNHRYFKLICSPLEISSNSFNVKLSENVWNFFSFHFVKSQTLAQSHCGFKPVSKLQHCELKMSSTVKYGEGLVNWSISQTFYTQLIWSRIPKGQKRQSTQAAFCAFAVCSCKTWP